MSIKENFQKFINEKRLDKEKKIIKKEISERENKINQDEIKNDVKDKEKNKKGVLERVKDAGLIAFAVMLIGFGYINFSESSNTEDLIVETASNSVSNNLGDVQLVSSESGIVENDNNEVSNNVTDSSEEEDNSAEETNVSTSSTDIASYFAELKLNRDNIYSQKLETYQQMIDSSNISSEQKSIAIQEIEDITETQNEIAVAEELIKLKGFENVVIYVNENSVNVIVRSAALSSEQVAQIQNIVTRELNVDVSNISISNK